MAEQLVDDVIEPILETEMDVKKIDLYAVIDILEGVLTDDQVSLYDSLPNPVIQIDTEKGDVVKLIIIDYEKPDS